MEEFKLSRDEYITQSTASWYYVQQLHVTILRAIKSWSQQENFASHDAY